MRRALLLCLLVLAALPAAAGAHPLGNFSVNHLSTVSVSDDRVDVRYILDQAEIPTFQERDVAGRRAAAAQAGRGAAPAGPDRRRPARRAAAGRAAVAEPSEGCRWPGDDARRAAADAPPWRHRRASRCVTARSPAGWAGTRSSRAPGAAPRCVRTHPRPTPPAACGGTPTTRSAARPTCARRRSPSSPGDGTLQAPDGRRVSHTDERARRPALARVQLRRGGPGRADPAAADRVRVGSAARALAGPRQGDGGRVPRRHARDRAPRGRARRHGDHHAHDRRVRARPGRARAVGVRAAGGPVPVAEPRLGPARAHRRCAACCARTCGAGGINGSTITTNITTTRMATRTTTSTATRTRRLRSSRGAG